jgi:hypothetical protein
VSQQLNLFNPLFLRQKKYFSSRTMLRGLAVVVAALATLHAFQRIQLAGLERHYAEADEQLKTAQQQLTKFAADAKRAPSKVLVDEATRLEAQLKAQEALLEGLDGGGLGNTEGFSRYLAALARQTLPGVWLTGFSANGRDGPLAIRGRLLRPELLPSYIRMLNREDALRGHGFSDVRLTAQEGKVAPSAGKGDNRANAGVRYVEFTLGATKTSGAAK